MPRLAFHQQLGEADDRLQRVVQLVGDTGYELADGREALAVNQLLAHLRLVCDVPFDTDEMGDRAAVI